MHIPGRSGEVGRPELAAFLEKLAALMFKAILFLTFVTPSWRYGPFSWLPLRRFELLAGGPVELGLLNLLPILLVLSWLLGRLLARSRKVDRRPKWRWGRPGITMPLLGLTLLGMFSLDPLSPRRTFIYAGALALAWLVYLYFINERPRLTFVLAAVAFIQGSVSIAQFMKQADIGLRLLGELPLDPIFGGVSVLWARGELWLRAYGLTAHPNLLGAILAVILLLLLPAYKRAGRANVWLLIAFNVGLLGLLFTFSRAAGIAFVAGLALWLLLEYRSRIIAPGSASARSEFRNMLLPLLAGALFMLFFGDLVASRVTGLEAPSEARSIAERQSSSAQAVDVISANLLSGVGLGNYSSVAGQLFRGAVRVHNVPLLVTAELGLPALLLYLWLAISPFWYYRRRITPSSPHPITRPSPHGPSPLNPHPHTPPPIHVWLAVLIIGLFDTTLWITSNWQTAILFALIVAHFGRENYRVKAS